jgi:hypothetical protein
MRTCSQWRTVWRYGRTEAIVTNDPATAMVTTGRIKAG